MANSETNNTDVARVYDSSCGSSGMLVESERFVEANAGTRLQLTPESLRLSADAKKSESPRWR